jgi:acyl-CoA synthetase (NDP forming)
VPAFSAPEACTVEIDAMLRAGKLSAVDEAGTPTLPLPDLASYGTGSIDEAAAKTLFAGFGVPVAKEVFVADGAEAMAAVQAFSGNVVLKILSAEITHKSDVGGVAVNVPPAEVASRLARMASDVQSATGIAPQRFLVQEMVKGGVEVILGMHRDALGTAILLGMGGVTAELFGDTTLRLLPGECGLTREAALEMIGRLKTAPLLQGFRGRPKADVAALAEAIVAFSRMVATLGDRLVEAEMNPVFVLPEGQGVVAADGVAVLAGNDKP